MKVGIIGGGALGLAAAYELGLRGHQAQVFERAPFLGGQASTFEVGGGRLEKGYHHLFRSDKDIVNLIHELGLGPKLHWIESKVGLFHGDRVWNFASPKDLLTFRPLGLLDRLRLGLVTLYLQKTRNWRRFEGVTAREWLEKRVGRRPYQVIWEPMLRGKFGKHYDEVSMAWLWGKIYLRVSSRERIWAKEKLGYPIGSFGEIFDVLDRKIREMGGEVHISAGVKRVVMEDGRARGLEVETPGSAPEVRQYDAVIATTPSYVFTRLVPPLPADYQKMLTGVTYLSAVLAILVLDRPLTSKYWLNIADRSMPFVGLIEQTNFVDPSLYGGKHIVYLTNYPATDEPIYQMSPEELLDEYLPHLPRINPDFDRSWIQEYHHHKVDAAQPIIGVNYSQRIPSNRTPIPGLYLANTTQIYPEDRGTNYSVKLGRQVARMVLEDHGH
ncbi:MAG: NAD(P)/FAD-dependent oxidoreductase [Chloroflexi bacterium]|nr:NAD(P)/FAD-dependent oxidoreductase [Chloroflexota bacterium]MCZ6867448.1 NAD(P)/FAD-dependent oxidoreductase [Chloroflexota bacterium]